MTAAVASWLFFAFLLGYLAHVLIQALDPRDPWGRGYDEGWREGRRSRGWRQGPGLKGLGFEAVGEGNPERN
jgi:hypothetical protein